MVDPILDDELEGERRKKLYQKFQNYADEVKGDSGVKPIGKIQGKKVSQSKNSSLSKIFNTSVKKNDTTTNT